MKTFTARVRNGRIVLDKPKKLPEGSVLRITVAAPKTRMAAAKTPAPLDDMTAGERKALEASLDQSLAEERAGLTRPVEELLSHLENRRKRA